MCAIQYLRLLYFLVPYSATRMSVMLR